MRRAPAPHDLMSNVISLDVPAATWPKFRLEGSRQSAGSSVPPSKGTSSLRDDEPPMGNGSGKSSSLYVKRMMPVWVPALVGANLIGTDNWPPDGTAACWNVLPGSTAENAGDEPGVVSALDT